MANTIRIKRGLKANIAGLSLLPGELAIALDTLELFIGNTSGDPELIKASSSGSVESADKLTVARTLTGTGDASFVFTFDGSSNVSAAVALAASGVTAGTYTKVTVDAKGRVTTGSQVEKSDLPAIAVEDINGLQTALNDKANVATTYSKTDVDSLLNNISTNVQTNTEAIETEKTRAIAAESDLQTKITALSGTVVYLGLVNNSTEEIVANTGILDAKALSIKGNVLAGYTLMDNDRHEWVCSSVAENTGNWIDMGQSTVAIASNTITGIVKGSATDFMISINAQGEMSVNKLESTLTSLQNNKLNKTDVVANTTETVAGKALDATIGKLLNDAIQTKITGPAASVNSNLPLFDGVTGKLLKDSGLNVSDLGVDNYNDLKNIPIENFDSSTTLPDNLATGIWNDSKVDGQVKAIYFVQNSTTKSQLRVDTTGIYKRTYNTGTSSWNDWFSIEIAVIDNLTSTSTTAALSAAQGKALNDSLNTKLSTTSTIDGGTF